MGTHRDPVIKWLDDHHNELPKGKVLEVGCGAEFQFRKWFDSKGYEWTAVTPQHYESGKIEVGLIEHFWGVEKSYDLIFGCHVFEHVHDIVRALRNCRRMLKDGGILVMATPLLVRDQILEGGDHDHIMVLNDWQWTKLCQFVGFSDIKVIKTGEHHREDSYITVATR